MVSYIARERGEATEANPRRARPKPPEALMRSGGDAVDSIHWAPTQLPHAQKVGGGAVDSTHWTPCPQNPSSRKTVSAT